MATLAEIGPVEVGGAITISGLLVVGVLGFLLKEKNSDVRAMERRLVGLEQEVAVLKAQRCDDRVRTLEDTLNKVLGELIEIKALSGRAYRWIEEQNNEGRHRRSSDSKGD